MILFLFALFACEQERTMITTKDGTKILLDKAAERPSYCYAKKNTAVPSCWTSYDWEVYCERVQCKRRTSK